MIFFMHCCSMLLCYIYVMSEGQGGFDTAKYHLFNFTCFRSCDFFMYVFLNVVIVLILIIIIIIIIMMMMMIITIIIIIIIKITINKFIAAKSSK